MILPITLKINVNFLVSSISLFSIHVQIGDELKNEIRIGLRYRSYSRCNFLTLLMFL